MALEHEVQALSARAERGLAERVRIAMQMAFERRTVDAYRACFLDPNTGELTAHARTVVADLAKLAGVGVTFPLATDAELRTKEGQRSVVLHLLARFALNDAKFARLSRQLRENEND